MYTGCTYKKVNNIHTTEKDRGVTDSEIAEHREEKSSFLLGTVSFYPV